MNRLPGYDEWKTREPDEGPGEDLRWFAEVVNPHNPYQEDLGPFDSKENAIAATNAWVLEHTAADNSEYRYEYFGERVYSIDLNKECTCGRTLRSRRNCEIHGIDPDTAYDERRE